MTDETDPPAPHVPGKNGFATAGSSGVGIAAPFSFGDKVLPLLPRLTTSTVPAAPLAPAARIGAAEEEPPLGIGALGPTSERKAREWALVLQSSETWHLIRRTPYGFIVVVRDEDLATAEKAISLYELENKDFPPRPARERAGFSLSPWAAALFVALVGFFGITGPAAHHSGFFARGTAVSNLILSTEPWRAVTALTLHADTEHVVGNAISGTVFGSAVFRRFGPGGGALALVASGAIGNALNAVFHHSFGGVHRSIGASTAVLGAVGILAATQLVMNRRLDGEKRTWTSWAIPILGGLALLGAIGSGSSEGASRVDLGAHLFGFVAGVLIGLLGAFASKLKAPSNMAVSARGSWLGRSWRQIGMFAAAAAIVGVSWAAAVYA